MINQRHNVLLITNHSGAGGGAEQQLLALAAGVNKELVRVVVVTLYQGTFQGEPVPDAEFICLNRSGKYDFSPIPRIIKILKQYDIDIIQPFLSPATFFGIVPAFMARTPIKVITERCGVRNNPGTGYKIICKLEDLFGRKAQVAVANSAAGQRMLIDRGYQAEKTMVIYNGLNTKRLEVDPKIVADIRAETGLEPGHPVVGIAAWIAPAKDHAGFVKSAKIILERRPEVRFAILGDGPLRPEIEVMVKDMQLTEKVIFLGRHNRVGNYLSLLDVAVLCSVDHEGCSNSILEYMFLGKPVVATDVGGNNELVRTGENGYLVPPRDPEALAGAIFKLLDDPVKARLMGENGRAWVLEHFSLQRMVADYQKLWLELLQEREREGGLVSATS